MNQVKRKRLPPISRLRRKADHLWSTAVLLKATPIDALVPTCAVCEKTPAISAHHIFHKSMHGRFRYDLRNGLPVCAKCHLMERRDPAPVVFSAMRYHGCSTFIEFGSDVMAHRGKYGREGFKRNRKDYELIIQALEDGISLEVWDAPRPTPA